MTKRKSRRRRTRNRKFLWFIAGITAATTFGMAVYMLILAKQGSALTKPDELLLAYMDCISERNYKEMYQMLDMEASGQISGEDFIKRNSAIYEGIEIQNMTTTIISYSEERNVVQYQTAFDTVAGNISFENEAYFLNMKDSSGAEGVFESELKGQNGCRIYIVDAEGNTKEELANRLVEYGKTIKLTIDSKLQSALYEQFREDKSCSAAMNPYTGEVLALVSTPSYDNNDFIMGLSSEKWTALNEDENKPLYNRFRQVWCPGSTFKPITAAIGLESGAVDPNEDYGNVGLSWQKDASWGSYHVTTLHAYDPVVLENALIYSDNIYFAKAALKIGADEMKDSLLGLGFQEELPFEIVMSQSQYSNTENIETEIQLADSGYGQGQILVNPLHMACIYTAFCNEGNVIKPYLVYSPDTEPEYWISDAFSENTTNLVLEGIKKVINDSHGTGYAAHREDVLLAGKTGTAEIKASKEDTSGTELGWFAVFTEERTEENPILIVSMVEDVKGRGGSGYVVGKDKEVLESWFGGNN